MKLYLSSLRIPLKDQYLKLFDSKSDLSVALIANAWDNVPLQKSKPFINSTTNELKDLGMKVIHFDLRKYHKKQEELYEDLNKFSGVWVMGGNTFYLNWHMRRSGFSKVIRDLLNNGLVYGGESAGAVVAGSTLHGIELLDDPAEAPDIIWEGLGLVDFGIVPHWGNEKYKEHLENCKQEMKRYVPVTTLTDDQSILVVDENISIDPKTNP